ncbi:MAG: VWA domain-containing protein, partial [Myxococcales bacterium]|nr:VWA domain-containing protein [Myxococcales bacterium]
MVSEFPWHDVVERLSASRAPLLFGVRHHSPACAAAMRATLDAYEPDVLLVELPGELDGLLEWLGHAEARAPLALACGRADGAESEMWFYPFADFSPELVAVRWAVARGVPVRGIDLPMARRGGDDGTRVEVSGIEGWGGEGGDGEGGGSTRTLLDAICRRAQVEDVEALWDLWVESRALGQPAEVVRRAALRSGFAMRLDSALGEGVHAGDLRRERYMREQIAAALRDGAERACAVVGAFHAAALLDEPVLFAEVAYLGGGDGSGGDGSGADDKGKGKGKPSEGRELVSAIAPYDFELLDSRSGYPAGIRDPAWQQQLLGAHQGEREARELCIDVVVRVCRRLRARGHVAGLPDSREAVRVAEDLARLRGLPSPSRRELLEGITSALAQGELYGRGRVLAEALDEVMVGGERGRLAEGTPRSGLLVNVWATLRALGLPGPDDVPDAPLSRRRRGVLPDGKRLRLDVLRSDLDRRRHVTLMRLSLCGVPYGEQVEGDDSDAQSLTAVWQVDYTPQVEATIELCAARGVTLAQAARGALRASERRLERDDALLPAARVKLCEQAAECGLPVEVARHLERLLPELSAQGDLADVVAAATFVERLARGHVPGCPVANDAGTGEGDGGDLKAGEALPGAVSALEVDLAPIGRELLAVSVRCLEGLFGADEVHDARALLDLARLFQRAEVAETHAALGSGRLLDVLRRLARDGSALMQGAASGVLVLLGDRPAERFAVELGSWVDASTGDGAPDGSQAFRTLAARLCGALTVAAPLIEADPALLDGLGERIERIEDERFIARLPALRQGFDVLSPAARGRLLDVIVERLQLKASAAGGATALDVDDDPALLSRWAAADAAAMAKVGGMLSEAAAEPQAKRGTGTAVEPKAQRGAAAADATPRALEPAERWRLVLGQQREKLSPRSARMARALDELYGFGRGEGARGNIGGGGGGGAGQEASYPTVREWAEDLEALFEARVREEVLGEAVARGRSDAILALDPDSVAPSVDLLTQVLSLRGGLPESRLPELRRLVRRIVEQLVDELALRVQPALAGLTTARPTRRPVGPLDLRRTVRANLASARVDEDGEAHLVAERLIFRTRSRRSLDWHVVIVVDVSGSMEPSVVYSALMAAILSGVPALSVSFITFSTEVIDLSEHAEDPLALLLEVQVGGGTHIAKGLRYARGLVRVPQRTLLLLISDFEEGYGVGELCAEAERIVGSGVTALGLAALDDEGKPRYNTGVAELLASVGMGVAALTPLELARWVGEQVRGGG